MLGLNPATMASRERSSGLASDYGAPVRERRFSPYVDNHGSVVAIAGADFVVVASDTRLSGSGYSILTREQPKLFELSESTVLASTGCWCDVLSFARLANARFVSNLLVFLFFNLSLFLSFFTPPLYKDHDYG